MVLHAGKISLFNNVSAAFLEIGLANRGNPKKVMVERRTAL
jgi:hypothetical protein